MSKDPQDKNSPGQPDDDAGFGLTRPTGEFANIQGAKGRSSERAPSRSAQTSQASLESVERSGAATTAWRGFEEEEEFEHEVEFHREKDTGNEEMDMTPMVDVTFLLLIFFMVTASFTLQKTIPQPPIKSEDPSLIFKEQEDEDEFVQIIIDQFNTYRLTSRDAEEIEAASDNEMRRRLKDMVQQHRAKRLIIIHHGDAIHDKVITAWDAGVSNNIGTIITQLTEVDF
ncbi:MAG TPA: biopolymer transporter ExbD [Pirellulaceae bacterium]|nr:biopolymer transporter ExbD [Pirellulaceae bacterium]HMO90833.1 biopolymer transporter ExbD [Pirellulaceae bacterium]HMP68084.1 biopolymer transporter ExbD [Pirellulaceae bacterium]